MIDIHSHILPGIDDGAQTIEDSIVMARAAVEDGIHTIIATPHHQNGRYINGKQEILPLVEDLNNHLENHNIPLTVLPGQESRIHGEMIEGLHENEVLTLNANENGYVFVEFPSNHVPRYAKQMLFDIQVDGYQPIIVHPERNTQLIQESNLLLEMVEKGTYTQVTAASVTGRFGKKIKKFTHQLIESNLTHLIASDAHNTTSRGFCLSEAFEEVDKEFGPEIVDLFLENSEAVVSGAALISDQPQPIKRKKLLGIFG
ncbi:tyrosine-protein phosphatase [Halobacillus litoralis]|uniref:Tyrosine-protein phosphatase n=1 Tax=Halobacillus litoralis TaxID=45668 RepID=A0A410MFC7_9BACI|nr:CpsB/CapC family capsule biosynthesis tyrosine phosphatase [Halobacillus litoralis]QAS53442.1 tyrosine protein phosphatase [Halobacillus litoralis]